MGEWRHSFMNSQLHSYVEASDLLRVQIALIRIRALGTQVAVRAREPFWTRWRRESYLRLPEIKAFYSPLVVREEHYLRIQKRSAQERKFIQLQ